MIWFDLFGLLRQFSHSLKLPRNDNISHPSLRVLAKGKDEATQITRLAMTKIAESKLVSTIHNLAQFAL